MPPLPLTSGSVANCPGQRQARCRYIVTVGHWDGGFAARAVAGLGVLGVAGNAGNHASTGAVRRAQSGPCERSGQSRWCRLIAGERIVLNRLSSTSPGMHSWPDSSAEWIRARSADAGEEPQGRCCEEGTRLALKPSLARSPEKDKGRPKVLRPFSVAFLTLRASLRPQTSPLPDRKNGIYDAALSRRGREHGIRRVVLRPGGVD